MITRHNRARNLIYQISDAGLLSPDMEKLGILGPTDRSRRRPGDVSFKSWAPNRGLAIDVAVICSMSASHLYDPRVRLMVFSKNMRSTMQVFKGLTTTLLLWYSRLAARSIWKVCRY